MTQRSNQLRNTYGPRNAARVVVPRAAAAREARVDLRGRLLAGVLAIASIITVLVLITSLTSAEYGFV